MKCQYLKYARIGLCLALASVMAGCNESKADPKAEAPPPANVQADMDANNFKVDHPELFPLAMAVAYKAAPALNVTGVVQPDLAPPPANVQADMDANNFKVDHPELFPLAMAVAYKAAPALNVTGVVQPD